MKLKLMLLFILLVAVITTSCTEESDEMLIQGVLESSPYIADGALQIHDDSTQIPADDMTTPIYSDTIPYVRWVRWIQRPIIRKYEIVINGDSADVTIYAHLYGEPPGYGFFVNNDPIGPVYQRTISDSLVRRVKLWKDEGGEWHIGSLTAADIYTFNNEHPVFLSQIIASVPSRNYVFVISSPNAYFERNELPIFLPNDTVHVTVICSAQDDSTWAFLHHGVGHRTSTGYHNRQPFYRNDINTFTRTWIIADDSIITTPAVRHSAVDVLGWQTLFGADDATYYSRIWCLPYIVLQPGEEIPDD